MDFIDEGDLIDMLIQVWNLEPSMASLEEIRNFEYSFLGEVRMLGALRKHSCIVEIFGHQLSSRWAPPMEGIKENRLLQSIIVMEYIKGGSLKVIWWCHAFFLSLIKFFPLNVKFVLTISTPGLFGQIIDTG